MTEEKEALTCETCKRWIRYPGEAGEKGAGECRLLPPQSVPLYSLIPTGTVQLQKVAPGAGPHGGLFIPGGVNVQVVEETVYGSKVEQWMLKYPPCPAEFPACAQHLKRESWELDSEEFIG
jgi:hypothetical protein